MNTQSGISLDAGMAMFFDNNGIGFGNADVFCLGRAAIPGQILDILGQIFRFRDSEGRSPVSQLIVVMTADVAERYGGLENVAQQLQSYIAENSVKGPVGRDIADWLRVISPANQGADALYDIVRVAPSQGIVVVANAAMFRDGAVKATVAAENLALYEDFWVPQLTEIARKLLTFANQTQAYVALIAGELSPRRGAMSRLLQSIDGVGVVGAAMDNDLEAMLASRGASLNADLAAGRIGSIFRTIDALPANMDAEKPFLKVQMLHRAKLFGQALQMIEQDITIDESADPFALAKLGHIAIDCGSRQLAIKLLGTSIDGLTTRESLELAAATADDIEDSALSKRAEERLAAMYPGSDVLERIRLRRAIAEGRYRDAATVLAVAREDNDGVEFFRALAEALDGSGIPDYAGISERLSVKHPDRRWRLHAALVKDALKRMLPLHAYDMALRSGEHGKPSVGLLLDVLDRLVLERDAKGNLPIPPDELQAGVTKIVQYLAEHPEDGHRRLHLTRLLSLGTIGDLGVPLVTAIGMDGFSRPLKLQKFVTVKGYTAQELDARMDFLKRAFGWLGQEGPFLIGKAKLPAELMTEDPEQLLPAIATFLLRLGEDISSDDDAKALMNWMMLGVCIVPYTKDPNQDLELVRLAAGRLVTAGRPQLARDLAEQALQSSAGDPFRGRIAWSVMADIYLRIGNALEGLIGFAAAAWGDTTVVDEQAWHEAHAFSRGLREIGLLPQARRAAISAMRLVESMGHGDLNRHRGELMILAIDMQALAQSNKPKAEDIESLLSRATSNAEKVIARNDEPTPVALLLGQVIRLASERNVQVPDAARSAFAALIKDTGSSGTDLVHAMAALCPTARQVMAIHGRMEQARYSDDVAHDSRAVTLSARRMLAGEEILSDTGAVALGIELLSDRAVAMPGWEATSRPAEQMKDEAEAARWAAEISAEGICVLMAGFDSKHRLLRMSAHNGVLDTPVREPTERFSAGVLEAWAHDFPYSYGLDNNPANIFYTSTEGLSFEHMPKGPTVLVLDTHLQEIPPNLLRSGEDFAGQKIPIASAPSLSWLLRARKHPAGSDGRRNAWISTAERHGRTLSMIAERLLPTLSERSFRLDTGTTVPEDFAGSELALIAAHGGLEPDEQFFQRVSDEGNTRLSISDMASGLRNVGVVILFVCSGGRSDKHPTADTNVGLAKEILDRGCSVVIASPWPLDARVTYHWLPEFMAAWDRGCTAVQSNFLANQAVAKAMGNHLETWLAMNLFGDPLRTARRDR